MSTAAKLRLTTFTQADYDATLDVLLEQLGDATVKNRAVIHHAFAEAVKRAPQANPSDLWHHVIYRAYVDNLSKFRAVNSPQQSWVRASGDALEIFLQGNYSGRSLCW